MALLPSMLLAEHARRTSTTLVRRGSPALGLAVHSVRIGELVMVVSVSSCVSPNLRRNSSVRSIWRCAAG